MELTLHGTLPLNARKHPHRDAIVCGRDRLTFGELDRRVNELANGLRERGLRRGDVCGVLLPNCVEYFEVLLALAKLGVAWVAINPQLTRSEAQYILDHCDARALVVGAEHLAAMRDLVTALPRVDRGLCFAVGTSEADGFPSVDAARAGNEDEPEDVVLESDTVRLAYTSGTTGRPKGVITPHRSQVLGFFQFALEYGLTGDAKMLVAGPMAATAPFMFSFLALYFGGTAHLLPRFDADLALATITDEQITAAFLVPTMFHTIFSLPEDERLAKYDMSSLRLLVSGTAPRHAATREKAMRYFAHARVNESYGSTEGSVNTNLRHEDQIRKIETVGQPVVGCDIRIVDTDGKDAAPGEVGEIWVRSLGVAAGYLKDAAATAASFLPGGWYATGDLGWMDDERFVTLVDRKNDVIITGGMNVYPTEVEQSLFQHPSVAEAAVVGLPDDRWGEAVTAFVVCLDGHHVAEAELLDHCRRDLASYKRPKAVHIVSDLPKSSVGKVLRRELRDRNQHGRVTDATSGRSMT